MADVKYVYQISDFLHRAKNPETGLFEEIQGLKEFALPDVEAATTELSGIAGLPGTLELIDWGNIGALELTLKYSGFPENAYLVSPDKQEHQLYWADKYTDKSGETGYISYRVDFTGMLKTIPGGSGTKGEASDREIKYSLKTYKLSRNGVVLFDYDPANNIIKFGERNYADELHRAVLGE